MTRAGDGRFASRRAAPLRARIGCGPGRRPASRCSNTLARLRRSARASRERRRQGDPEARAAALGVQQLHRAAVGLSRTRTIASPQAAAAAWPRRRPAAREALEYALAHRRRHSGPRSATSSTAASPSRRTDTVTGVPGGVWIERVLDQVRGQAVQVVLHAVDDHRAGRGRPRPGGRASGPASAAASQATGPGRPGGARRARGRRRRAQAAAGQPPAGASGATSAARRPPSPAARPRAPPRAARGWRGCS